MPWDASIRVVGTLVTGDVNKITKQAMEGLDTFAKDMLESLTPVKTGNMKSRWNVTTSDRLFMIRNSAYYSNFINSGTRKIAPRFMVEKTIEAVGEEFKGRVESILSETQRTKSIRDFTKQVSKLRVRNITSKPASKT